MFNDLIARYLKPRINLAAAKTRNGLDVLLYKHDDAFGISIGGKELMHSKVSASEAYLVENGKITAPVKGATLIGNGPDAMSKISMIGNDMALDAGVGTCGKNGQSVPVGVGQPTLKIGGITVGGTQAA